ncbi:MAG: AzlD family protein [Neisseria sp.]|uniref:AzlD family protein n=1 Tax=Neisseria sp. TaxID=192066 RepID=UPI0026DACAF9|nr:AzlD family protein [Neisseria sp.]MDO4641469.1 AzlD family protein [Neisseria sp.]
MISWASFLTILGMLVVTYTTRLIGFFALRNRLLSPRAAAVMEAAPGCVLISVIAPHFVSDKPNELVAMVITLIAASRLPMLPTVLIAVASSGLLGYLMKV